jgi:ammonium transporter
MKTATSSAQSAGDTAWMLVSSAFVMLMVPGLALFYGGIVRRKNVLATMMHSMIALAVVGVYWVAIGYCLAFGNSIGGFIGWNPDLIFLQGIKPADTLPGTNIPVYLHVMFQGMFAIITPALISGAVAERIRFAPYCLFLVLWVTFVYCPLAHWVWAMNWWAPITVDGELKAVGTTMVGWLGQMGALDFAGGTVVHIAAGFSALAAIIALRKRLGYPEQFMHPNSMVLTLTGAGLLWFGWFGFNGGSALFSSSLAVSAFSATQAAAAGAGLTWVLAEWLHKGKPTALGLASGIVAGLVAVTPASGFVYLSGGLIIGLIAGIVCYAAVCLKPLFKYDDSLDAFGVHGIGGFLGAVLTGVFCSTVVNSAGKDAGTGQLMIQVYASIASAVFAFVLSIVLVKVIDLVLGFTTDERSETEGLDLTEHAEVGFHFGPEVAAAPLASSEPRAADVPPNGEKRFGVVVTGVDQATLLETWSQLCQPTNGAPSADFKLVYPYMTTVKGNRFNFRGGDAEQIRAALERLFRKTLGASVEAHVETMKSANHAAREMVGAR